MWAMAREPLTTSLLKLKDPQEQEKALLLFKLVRCGVVLVLRRRGCADMCGPVTLWLFCADTEIHGGTIVVQRHGRNSNWGLHYKRSECYSVFENYCITWHGQLNYTVANAFCLCLPSPSGLAPSRRSSSASWPTRPGATPVALAGTEAGCCLPCSPAVPTPPPDWKNISSSEECDGMGGIV